MSYLGFFDLHAEPFAHAPSDRLYYASQQHTEALSRLTHAVRSMQGLALLVGDIGRGKSTLARRLLRSLPENEFEASMLVVVHAAVSANWLLKRIALQLNVPDPAEENLALISQLYQRLIEIHESGKRAVVLIDEAQMLGTRQLMEEFRGLLNLEVPGHKLITFVFFGLPEIETNLRLDPPLAQRVVLKCALKALSEADTEAYVKHRLQLAGAEREIFPPDALASVHAATQGVPRLINTLCDNVLLELFFSRQQVATPQLVRDVALNLSMDPLATSIEPPAAPVPAPASPVEFAGSVPLRGLADDAETLAHLIAQEEEDAEYAEPNFDADDDNDVSTGGWKGVQVAGPMLDNGLRDAIPPPAHFSSDDHDFDIHLDVPAPIATPITLSAAATADIARRAASASLLDEVDELLAEISKR